MRSRRSLAAGLSLVATLLSSSLALSDNYPTRPVRILIGFAVGSSVDLPARLLAKALTDKLGQPFVVENRAGAGGNLAAEAVARAEPDGYTLLLATNSLSNAAVMGASYDPVKDFAPVIAIATGPQMLVAHPSLEANNLKELIALAKAKPDQIMYGGSGGFAMTRLGGVLLNNMAGIKLMHVFYTGSAPALVDLLAGRIQLTFAPALPVIPHLEKGTLKAIGVTTAKRTSVAPNVPTIAEAGLPGYELGLWYGLVAPAGTPPDVIEKLSRVVNDALKSDEVGNVLRAQAIDPVGGTPEDFAKFIRDDTAKMAEMAKIGGIQN